MNTSVVVATLIQSVSDHDENQIFTWRKYRLSEWLSKQVKVVPPEIDVAWERSLERAPKSLMPLEADEFLMAELGGVGIVDGVKLTQPGMGNQVLPQPSKHLLSVFFGSSEKLAISNYGPAGQLTIDTQEVIHSRVPQRDSEVSGLLREIDERANGKLSSLRIAASSWKNSRR